MPFEQKADDVILADRSFIGRALVVVALAVAAVIVLYLWREVSSIFLVAFAGILFGVMLDALSVALSRRTPLKRRPALAAVVIIILVVLGGLGWIIGPQITEQMSALGSKVPDAVEEIRSLLNESQIGRMILAQIPSESGSVVGLSGVQGFFSSAFGALGNVFVALFVAIYVAYDPRLYVKGVMHLFPVSARPRSRDVLKALGRAMRHWLAGRFASMAVVGILTTIGLLIVGVPLAMSLGVIAAFLSFVPYVGPIVSVVPAALVGLLESPMTALYVIIVYGVVQFCESYLVTPLIQKKAVSLPPALLIIAQVMGGLLFGVIGIVLATPLTVCLIVIVQMIYVQDTLGDEDVQVLGS